MKTGIKKVYASPSLKIEVIETEDIITISAILTDINSENLLGMGKISMEIDFE